MSFSTSNKRSAIIAGLFFAVLSTTILGVHHFYKNENQQFEEYTYNLFCQEVSGNTISLHYTLKNPSAYGITDAPLSIGSCTTDTSSVCAAIENALALLKSHDRRRLSAKNKLTYDVLEDYYTTAFALAPYSLYEEPLSPLTGTQSQLPVILSEYQFYSASDIDTYLKLLKKVPDYFDSILEFEQARAEKGLFMSESALNDLIEECSAFVKLSKDNYLYSSFEERLNGLEEALSENEKKTYDRKKYTKTNDKYIKKYIFPAYKKLTKGLNTLRDECASDSVSGGLSKLPGGRQYYELLSASETGSNRSIPKLQELARRQIMEDLGAMQTSLAQLGASNLSSEDADSHTSDLFSSQGAILEDSNPISILNTLEGKMKDDFPKLPAVDVQIKYVQKSLEEYLSPAFYMIPALDNTQSNVIYINAGHIPDDLSLFTTLAHEGYPGHLYQNVYYMNQNPDPIRCLLGYGGYTEGWATYCEMLSYYYAPIPKAEATIMQKNTSIMLGLYALADMGIHYDGWSLSDTVSFFRDYGITDTQVISDIYSLIISDPANYLKYYIGYLEFLELKKYAIEEWGNKFTQQRFHRNVLQTGPAPFKILKKQLD
ncbi:MAG: DUF885 domain-containing protein [Dorea sp.]|jgi:uncharacterized protein (DUF885 family)|nr:DUF885 domain-containing protein [Dorea sp.]